MGVRDSAKHRARKVLVGAARACIANDRLPLSAKQAFVNRCEAWLAALDIDSDETPVESDYGTRFLAGQHSSMITSWLRFRGVYEPVLSEFILRQVHEGDVCVDVGANIGYFSLLFAKRVGPSGKVIAIEAAPDAVRRLRANVDLNEANGIVDIVEAACAPRKGDTAFYLHPHFDGWSRLNPPADEDPDRLYMGDDWVPVTVAADTLTAIVGSYVDRVSFIQVDIEGAEAAVGPQIAAEFSHPKLVVAIEVKMEIETTLKPFQERGFYIYDLHNDYRWRFEHNVPAITEAAYSDFYECSTADILLSRQPLILS